MKKLLALTIVVAVGLFAAGCVENESPSGGISKPAVKVSPTATGVMPEAVPLEPEKPKE